MKKRPKRTSVRGQPQVPVIDLFAGPGGLGEGFSAPSGEGERSRFRIALSIEKDATAHRTLQLRATFRQFPPGEVPEDYYRFMRGELDKEALLRSEQLKRAFATAQSEAWRAELGVEPASEVRKRVREALRDADESVLIGGPPCQAYSLAGRSRNQGNPNYRPEEDQRHSLYQEYLQVLTYHWPAVFVMENVKGLLSSRLNGRSVFSRIVEDLRDPHRALNGAGQRSGKRYRILALTPDEAGQIELVDADEPKRYVVRCEDFGIPQARHRVILLGVREDIPVASGTHLSNLGRVSASSVLKGLPALRSGLSRQKDSSEIWKGVLKQSLSTRWYGDLRKEEPEVAAALERSVAIAQRQDLDRGGEFVRTKARAGAHLGWYIDPRLHGVSNHRTRTHIKGDLVRYLFAASYASIHGRSPVLGEFPKAILPDHRNVEAAVKGKMFQDRFRVQIGDRPSTTVTSHISKDGHYYIHYDPAQCRSLTVREAARLQTFPDNYFFWGGRTAQYHQVGNAVPPLLARHIAGLVRGILGLSS